MRVSYNKLWKLLIDKNMKKGELRDAVGASKSTFAKLGKNENVSLAVLHNNNTVMAHIGRLREKLKEPARNPKFIKTVWGVGYTIEI